MMTLAIVVLFVLVCVQWLAIFRLRSECEDLDHGHRSEMRFRCDLRDEINKLTPRVERIEQRFDPLV